MQLVYLFTVRILQTIKSVLYIDLKLILILQSLLILLLKIKKTKFICILFVHVCTYLFTEILL